MPHPAPHQRGTDRWPRSALVEPGVHAVRGGEQCTDPSDPADRGGVKRLLGALHLALLIEIRRDQPLMQDEGVAAPHRTPCRDR